MSVENQKTVSKWCDEHYPGMGVKQRLLDLFEEASELAAALNVASNEEIVAHVQASLIKSEKDRGVSEEVPGEIGDVQIATLWLADELGVDSQEALNTKMAANRRKTTAQSQQRLAAKPFDHN